VQWAAVVTETDYVPDIRGLGVPLSAGEANIYLLNGIHNNHIYCIGGFSRDEAVEA
jgi:hypothetical protein